ncbi:MAG: hypothetical protein HRT70_10145, partial [Flavobacteriaceae bacterium]|nr:hypothetical protein [Flavobacteriaceae bacterium]
GNGTLQRFGKNNTRYYRRGVLRESICTLTSALDSRIKHLVTWASVCTLDRSIFKEGAELDDWKLNGTFYVVNGRTKQQMPHYIQFYNDYISNRERLDI